MFQDLSQLLDETLLNEERGACEGTSVSQIKGQPLCFKFVVNVQVMFW